MRVKPWVAFTTDLPDDQIEDGHNNIVLFGGRNVAAAIGEVFTRLGCKVADPENAGENGWEFALTYQESHRFWCQVNSTSYPVFRLLFEDMSRRPRAAPNAAAYAELAVKLTAALRNDPQFHDVTWWSAKEGPPEDEIDLAEAKKQAREDPSSPISAAGKEGGRPAWGCLAFALFVTISGPMTLWMFFAGLISGSPGEMIFCGVWNFGFGLLGLFLAWIRRVEA
jgi:hypothetical protein